MANTNVLEYKGYHARIEYSVPDKCLYGKIAGITDLVMFEGDPATIEHEFHAAVDDYLNFCTERNKAPDKEYSGSISLRTTSEIHRSIARYAEENGVSLSEMITQAWNYYTAHIEGQKAPVSELTFRNAAKKRIV
jgi:predicted HicB family RNase H-like nuclease